MKNNETQQQDVIKKFKELSDQSVERKEFYAKSFIADIKEEKALNFIMESFSSDGANLIKNHSFLTRFINTQKLKILLMSVVTTTLYYLISTGCISMNNEEKK